MLLGQLTPDAGTVKLGSNLQTAYFDQHRGQLVEDRDALYNVADGGDRVWADGREVHAISYLQKFLFTPERARSKVSALSGGERNRLLLAKLFARPVNLLVMDEPTNDLDLETLDVLEELLGEFDGTLLLVSHDRAFIDNVVTTTLAFEGSGEVRAYVGGYQDWLRQRPAARAVNKPKSSAAAKSPKAVKNTAAAARKLSYNEQRELQQLPTRIETLEAGLAALQGEVSDSGFYQRDADTIKASLARLQNLQDELAAAYARWEELE